MVIIIRPKKKIWILTDVEVGAVTNVSEKMLKYQDTETTVKLIVTAKQIAISAVIGT